MERVTCCRCLDSVRRSYAERYADGSYVCKPCGDFDVEDGAPSTTDLFESQGE